MSRLSLWSAGLVAALVVAVAAPLPWAHAQPPEGAAAPPSPLELARGLREQGMSDLALEYLREIENKPLSPDDKAAITLERAKCQLDSADDEPDEGARAGLVAEAKEGFAAFLAASPNHPRAAEAALALARLTSLDAKAVLSRAKKMDLPDTESPDYEDARNSQKAEAARARPLYKDASRLFGDAAKRLDAQLQQPNIDAVLRRNLEQERFEAELARGINQFSMGDTYLHPSADERKSRSDLIDEAREIFAKLAKGPNTSRTVWVARAWMAECEFEKDERKSAEEEFTKILASNSPFAEDGIRTVRFFQLKRKFFDAIGSNNLNELQAAATLARTWLEKYGTVRRARGEATAVRWYLAFNLQRQGVGQSSWSKDKPAKLLGVPTAARQALEAAEKHFRVIAQSDNEFQHRAARRRMEVVRMLLGEADEPPTDYRTFEECQMASLIQMGKLMELQRSRDKEAETKATRLKVVALLERARDLATEKDNPADVADVLVSLIAFYEQTDQPYQAAILGEHIARNMKLPGGKAPLAGSLALGGYFDASAALKLTDADALAATRRVDRDRAIRLARFLDEKFPADTATDTARHRLGFMLYEEGKLTEAFDVLVKIRPGYNQASTARLFEGSIAIQLLSAADSPIAADPNRKREVFARAVADLDRTVRPAAGAEVDAVRAYVSVRCRLALLHLQHLRVDPQAGGGGYARAQAVAKDVLETIPSFTKLARGDDKQLTLEGWELRLFGEDARTRAIFLRGQSAYTQQKYDDVFNIIGEVLAEMREQGRFTKQVESAGGMPPPKEPEPKKEPEKKEPPKKNEKKEPEKKEPPKKEPELKKEPEPKGDPDAMPAEDPVKARVAKLAGSVDAYRQNLVVLGLKTRMKQGQVDKANELLGLLKSFGGGIESHVATLQQLSLELAAQIVALKREGKAAEAKVLTDGFAKLVANVSAEPNLPPSMHLFIGQALVIVGESDKAVESLKKVPPPKDMTWLMPTGKLPTEEPQLTEARRQVSEYRRATLELVRALRAAKKYPEADALLKASMGTAEKQGWAFPSLEFRKEVAYLHEAQGADAGANAKAAQTEWGLALKEWNSLYGITRGRVERDLKDPPKNAGGNVDNQAMLRNKNTFFESFYDVQRCVVKANAQLLMGKPKLQETYDKVAKAFVEQEKNNGADMTAEVRMKYHDLLDEYPELKKAYQAAGGKLFLEKPAAAAGN